MSSNGTLRLSFLLTKTNVRVSDLFWLENAVMNENWKNLMSSDIYLRENIVAPLNL